jgi:hypothetical protein
MSAAALRCVSFECRRGRLRWISEQIDCRARKGRGDLCAIVDEGTDTANIAACTDRMRGEHAVDDHDAVDQLAVGNDKGDRGKSTDAKGSDISSAVEAKMRDYADVDWGGWERAYKHRTLRTAELQGLMQAGAQIDLVDWRILRH